MAEQTITILALLRDEITARLGPITKGFEGLQSSVAALADSFDPLTSRALSFVAGFSLFEIFNKSIDAAQGLVHTNEALRVSFNDDEDVIGRVSKTARDYGNTTEYSALQIKQLVTELHNGGVAASDIDRATRLAIDATARYGGSLQGTGNQISLLYQGIVPRSIGASRAAIKELGEGTKDSAVVLDRLQAAVEGTAARLAANDPFTQQAIKARAATEQYARIGLVLEDLRLRLEGAIVPALKSLADALETPAARVAVDAIGELISALVRAIPTIAEVYLGFQTLNIGVAALTTTFEILEAVVGVAVAAVGFFASPLGITILAVAALAYAIGGVSSATDLWGEITRGVGDRITRVIEGVRSGTLSLKGAWTVVVDEALVLISRLDADVITPLQLLFQNAVTRIAANFKLLWDDIQFAGLYAARFVGDAFLSMTTEVARGVDALTGAIADALGKIPRYGQAAADAIRTSLAPAAAGARDVFDKSVDAALTQINDAAKVQERTKATADKQYQDGIVAAEQRTKQYVASLRAEEDAILAGGSATPGASAADPATKAQADRVAAEQRADVTIASLRAQYDDVMNRRTDELSKAENALELAELQGQYARRDVTLTTYLSRKSELENRDSDAQIARLDAQIARAQTVLETAQPKSSPYVDALGQINELEAKRQALLVKQGTAIEKQTEEARKLTQAEDDRQRKEETDLSTRELKAVSTTRDQDPGISSQIGVELAKQEEEIIKLQREGASEQEIANVKRVQALELAKKQVDVERELVDAHIKQIETDVTRVQTTYNDVVTVADAQEAAGEINLFQAAAQKRDAQDEYTEAIKRSIVQMQALLDTTKDVETQDSIRQSIQKAQTQLVTFTHSFETVGKDLRAAIQGPLEGMFSGLLTGTKTLQQAFAGFITGLEQQFASLAAKLAANAILSSIFSGLGGSGGTFGSILATQITTKNEGGIVPGDGPNRDSILAALTPGEFVLTREATRHYSQPALERMNRLAIPREAVRSTSEIDEEVKRRSLVSSVMDAVTRRSSSDEVKHRGVVDAVMDAVTRRSSSDEVKHRGVVDAVTRRASSSSDEVKHRGVVDVVMDAVTRRSSSDEVKRRGVMDVVMDAVTKRSSSDEVKHRSVVDVVMDAVTKRSSSDEVKHRSVMDAVTSSSSSDIVDVVMDAVTRRASSSSDEDVKRRRSLVSVITDAAASVRRNVGGLIPGAGPDRDSVFAALTPGEFVLTRTATRHYSPQVLEAMNRLTIPRSLVAEFAGPPPRAGSSLNLGGVVAARTVPDERPRAREALVVGSDQAMDRLLAGGGSALVRFMRSNKTTINAALGGNK